MASILEESAILNPNLEINQEKKKRGRKQKKDKIKKKPGKRGRKKKDHDYVLKPENVLDYICRNYPQLGVGRVRENILVALKLQKGYEPSNYVFDCLQYKGVKYYYDHYGNVINNQAEPVGIYIDSDNIKKLIIFDELDDKYDRMTSGRIIRMIREEVKQSLHPA